MKTAQYLGKCFGNSVKHIKLTFNGPTQEQFFNAKQWLETFAAF